MSDHDKRWEQALAKLSREELEFGQHKAAALLEVTELLRCKVGATSWMSWAPCTRSRIAI